MGNYNAKNQKDYKQRMRNKGFVYKTIWLKKQDEQILSEIFKIKKQVKDKNLFDETLTQALSTAKDLVEDEFS